VSESSSVDRLLEDLRVSGRYGSLTQSVLARTTHWALARTRSHKDAAKLARRRLHQIYGAFVGPQDLKRVSRLLDEVEAPLAPDRFRELCSQVLACHASTAERLPYLDRFTDVIRHHSPHPRTVVDLACGLNPFTLPWMDLPTACVYHAIDIDAQLLALTRRLGELQPVRIETSECDLVAPPDVIEGDAILLLKTLPSLERQEQGAARRLLEALRAPHVFVSFPARSLSGRDRGMRANYDAELDRMLPHDLVRIDSATFPTETLYVLTR
jgi:16S rRNA (guanine(1405)-N(7))-methyltransferase